jgi:hypothetical protein
MFMFTRQLQFEQFDWSGISIERDLPACCIVFRRSWKYLDGFLTVQRLARGQSDGRSLKSNLIGEGIFALLPN